MANKQNKGKETQKINELQIEEKKSRRTFWATIIVALISLAGVITPVLFDYYREQNMVRVTQTAHALNMTQSAVLVLSATPTRAPVSTSTPAPAQPVSVIAPLFDQLGSFPYLSVTYLDINRPDTLTYKAVVSHDGTYLWTYFWCANSEGGLQQNLSVMKLSFLMDNLPIPESSFYSYMDSSRKGWYCQIWTAMLTAWDSQTSSATLSVVYLLSEAVSDGEKTYHPGAYRHDLILSIQ